MIHGRENQTERWRRRRRRKKGRKEEIKESVWTWKEAGEEVLNKIGGAVMGKKNVRYIKRKKRIRKR